MLKAGVLLSYVALALGAFTVGLLGSQMIPGTDGQSMVPPATRSTLAAAAATDWTILSPKLLWAVEKARLAAQKRAQAELDVWRERVMQRVDPTFLDWHFGYFNKRYEDLKWIWRRITESGERADRKYLKAIADAIAEKALPPAEVESEIERIAKGAAEEFRDELMAIISEYRREMAEHANLFDARLQEVHVTLVDADQLPVRVSLKDLCTRSHEENRAFGLLNLQLVRNLKSADPVARADVAAQRIVGVAAAAAKAGTAVSGAAKRWAHPRLWLLGSAPWLLPSW